MSTAGSKATSKMETKEMETPRDTKLPEIEKRAATTSSKKQASPLAATASPAAATPAAATAAATAGPATVSATSAGGGDQVSFHDDMAVLQLLPWWRADQVSFEISMLPSMVQGVMSNDSTAQLKATTAFRKLTTNEKNPLQEVINSGVVPHLVEFLKQNDKPSLQYEAAWTLTNIASGTSEQTLIVIDTGAVPVFVQLISSVNDNVREQAVWALGNIAGDSPESRDLVLQAGALQPLLKQLKNNAKLSMLRNGTWTLSNFCRGTPQPPFEWVNPALATLSQLIFQLE